MLLVLEKRGIPPSSAGESTAFHYRLRNFHDVASHSHLWWSRSCAFTYQTAARGETSQPLAERVRPHTVCTTDNGHGVLSRTARLTQSRLASTMYACVTRMAAPIFVLRLKPNKNTQSHDLPVLQVDMSMQLGKRSVSSFCLSIVNLNVKQGILPSHERF